MAKIKLHDVRKRCPDGELYIFKKGVAQVPGMRPVMYVTLAEFNQRYKNMEENNREELFPKIQCAIDHWLRTKDNSQLCDLLPSLEKIWEEYAKEENDYREGCDTYGYVGEEGVKNNMEYISDRWKCAFRIKWIIDGLRLGRI